MTHISCHLKQAGSQKQNNISSGKQVIGSIDLSKFHLPLRTPSTLLISLVPVMKSNLTQNVVTMERKDFDTKIVLWNYRGKNEGKSKQSTWDKIAKAAKA